jgi:hypothetical protein
MIASRGPSTSEPTPESSAPAPALLLDPALPGYLLLFLSAFVPTTYQWLKLALLLVCVTLVLVRIVRTGRLGLHPLVAGLALFYAVVGVAWTMRGLWTLAPGATSMVRVVVLWPLVFTLLAGGVYDRVVLRRMVATGVLTLLAIEGYTFWFLATEAGLLPRALFLPLDQGLKSTILPGTVEYNLYSISSLLHLVPFVLTALMVWPDDGTTPVRRGLLWIALAFGLATTVLTGRRALLLVVGLSFPIAMVARLALAPDARRESWRLVRPLMVKGVVVGAVAAVALAWGFELTPARVFSVFSEGFAFSSDPIAMMRARQVQVLLDRWWEAPVIGHGFGSIALDMIRDRETPWAYELSYLSLLMNVGMVGMVLYAVGVAWIIAMAVRVAHVDSELGRWLLPFVVGMVCFLTANGTNPYLMKFDYMWVLFVPVMFVNASLSGLPGGWTRSWLEPQRR